jgi:hypothetical protein
MKINFANLYAGSLLLIYYVDVVDDVSPEFAERSGEAGRLPS